MAGIGDIAGIDEGRDGIVSAMLGDLVGEQAPGLSNTAQANQQAQPDFYGALPQSNIFGTEQPQQIDQPEEPYGPAYFDQTFGEFQSVPIDELSPQQNLDDPNPDPSIPDENQLAANPEAMTAYASATQQGAPPVGQVEGPPVGQSGKGGVNAPVGITDYAARGDPFGELGLFGPDFYGGQQTDPVGTPQGVQGPYGEFGGFGPDAYGAYAGAAPEGYGGFGGGFAARQC